MGAQTSKEDTATIDACLADFPEQEQTHLLALFAHLVKSSAELAKQRESNEAEKTTIAHHQGHIDPDAFDRYFGSFLPPTLVACFRTTMQLHSAMHQTTASSHSMSGSSTSHGTLSSKDTHNKAAQRRRSLARSASVDARSGISKYGWVVTIHRLSKTLIEEQAGLSFMLQTHDASLESFIQNVMRAVMVYWTRFDIPSWQDVTIDHTRGTTEYLLTLPFQKALREAEMESMGDEDEDFQARKRKIQQDQDSWLASATKRTAAAGEPSTKELSRVAFLSWYEKTVEYQVLFTILVQNLFLRPPIVKRKAGSSSSKNPEDQEEEEEEAGDSKSPKSRSSPPLTELTSNKDNMSQEMENKLCRKNFVAPRIIGFKPPPHYSRLMSIADYFQLRYAMPTPGSISATVAGSTTTSPTNANTSKRRQSLDLLKGGSGKSGDGDGCGAMDNAESAPCPPFRLLFSSKTSGASFSTLLQKILYQGPTIMIMKDEDGYIFGAYADADWEQGPKFYGTDRSFLFTIYPQFRIYRPTRVNQNYQYLDSGTKTLPNGIGFGGQFRYFGLWLASDFCSGHSAAEPICSTYGSPRLSKQQQFKLDELEVWQVQPSVLEHEDGPRHSAMDTHADAVAMLEMANRKMYSKEVRAPQNVYADDEA
ncbi:hypothetical protein DFQ26_008610 [Actinomortierella ambigua]|nr:hypothetical protein DFQ26_008610 [Actinomortierella ambigua]